LSRVAGILTTIGRQQAALLVPTDGKHSIH
jgi:hypothetical protein